MVLVYESYGVSRGIVPAAAKAAAGSAAQLHCWEGFLFFSLSFALYNTGKHTVKYEHVRNMHARTSTS